MGQSTNAILAFGFDLGEELPGSISIAFEEHNGLEWDQFLCEDAGIIYPIYQDYPDYKSYQADVEKAVAQIPLEIIEHCSGDYPMYFLAVRGTKQEARRGYPQAIETSCYGNGELMRDFREFCRRHDIQWQDPKWYIFSMWN